jgi:hypothetical protein
MTRSRFGLFGLIVAGVVGFSAPALAESSGGNATHEFAAQSRPHITIYPRHTQPSRNAKRQCRGWLAKEYRVSGPVLVPRQQCWWE